MLLFAIQAGQASVCSPYLVSVIFSSKGGALLKVQSMTSSIIQSDGKKMFFMVHNK